MEYESAEPKVNEASCYLMSELPEVVRQLLQVNHRRGGDVICSFVWESQMELPESTTVKHNRTSASVRNLHGFGESYMYMQYLSFLKISFYSKDTLRDTSLFLNIH